MVRGMMSAAVFGAVVLVGAFGAMASAGSAAPMTPREAVVRPQGAQPAEAMELRVYDLRDLGAALPPDTHGRDSAEVLVTNLAAATGSGAQRLLGGVYAVVATPEKHATLEMMLKRVRDLYTQTYQVQLHLYSVPAAEAPAVGTAPENLRPGEAISRATISAPRRTPTEFFSLRRHAYIAEWQPVVGANAVGYDPESAEIEDGLRVQVTIGAGPDAPERGGARGEGGGELVQIRGELSSATLQSVTAPAIGTDGGTLMFFVPRVETRSIRMEERVALGTPTVVSVVDGFEDGQVVVLVVTVRKPGGAAAAGGPGAGGR